MKKIFVRKTFSYDPTFGGKHSRYDGYCQISLRKSDPEILKQTTIQFSEEVDMILCSDLLRGKETANLLNKDGVEVTVLSELNEIKFDLSKLISEAEFMKKGGDLVRKQFMENFISDNLLESRKEIQGRILNLLALLNKLPNGNYLLISHSFFMKVFQSLLKDKKLFENPILLREYFDTTKKTYKFGEGFEFEL